MKSTYIKFMTAVLLGDGKLTARSIEVRKDAPKAP
jgi:hypothetical protein